MIPAPFRRCLELAWEAYQAGSFPIGALVCHTNGTVVAEGRNRIGELEAPPGRLRNTALAHAEMDVLAQLPIGEYGDHVMYSSLEPCLLCRSALTMAHIGTVHHLAADAICDGLHGIRELTPHTVRRYPTMHGPYPGLEADVASILPMATVMARNPQGWAAEQYRTHTPHHAAVADRLRVDDAWPDRAWTLDQAIAHIGALLAR